MDELNQYYNKLAHEYEQIYHRDDSVRQSELAKIKRLIRNSFSNKAVLEIACGTGFWTEAAVQTAKQITCVDYSAEMLEVAKEKKINAIFLLDDAYSLRHVEGSFNAGLANFWFSHIPQNQIKFFLNNYHKKLIPGSTIIMADNIYNKEFGGEIINIDNNENTYKIRTLNDGTRYKILKNYYSEDELNSIFQEYSSNIKIHFGKFYWWIKYILN